MTELILNRLIEDYQARWQTNEPVVYRKNGYIVTVPDYVKALLELENSGHNFPREMNKNTFKTILNMNLGAWEPLTEAIDRITSGRREMEEEFDELYPNYDWAKDYLSTSKLEMFVDNAKLIRDMELIPSIRNRLRSLSPNTYGRKRSSMTSMSSDEDRSPMGTGHDDSYWRQYNDDYMFDEYTTNFSGEGEEW